MLQIHKASAGSGKTYKLAYEYIRALLGFKEEGSESYRLFHHRASKACNRHRAILAITFTNKATEEMKRRIVDELDALSSLPATGAKDANYAADLCKEFGCSRDDLASSAHKALYELLNDYSDFNVTTIDSFFQRVLRTFARELERQGDFSVEINDNLAVQTAVAAMIDDFNSDPSHHALLGKWIYNYMCEQIDNGKKSNFFNRKSHIFTSLVKVVSRICEEQFKPYSAKMQEVLADPSAMPRLKSMLTQKRKNILDGIKDESLRAWALLESHNAGLDKANQRLSIVKNFNDYLKQGIEVPKIKDSIFGETYSKLITGETKLFPDKSKVSPNDYDTAIELLKWVRVQYADYVLLGEIQTALDSLSLLGYAWRYLSELVAQNNIVLLSDTNHLLSRIIGTDEAPFIYERMGVQIRHYLIDEFQDTSRMQWSNLKPLVANGLSSGYDSLIIGDEKQSIYRFRNSDSSLLHHQVAETDFPGPSTHIGGKGPGENTNYRSAAEIIKFNNSLFSVLAPAMDVDGFENVIQDIPKDHADLKGYVEFVPFIKPKKSKKGATAASAEDDPDQGLSPADTFVELEAMTSNMLRQHSEGGYAWSDMAVLVATNINAAKVVEHIISHHPEIPVLSDEALYVRKSPAIQMIVGVLEILSVENGMKKASSEKAKYQNKAEVAVATSRFNYYHNHGMATDKAINLAIKTESAESLPNHLVDVIETIKSQKAASLPALVETIIHELLSEDERSSQIAFITAFQDFVLDYTSRTTPSLKAFLDHWATAKNSLSVSSASGIDAVRVMTIHKSKGLEFGCVHIPFASWAEAGKPRGQWVKFPDIEGVNPKYCPPALYLDFGSSTMAYATEGTYFHTEYATDKRLRYADTMNMTYVAYTRAERELYVYYDPTEGIGKNIVEILSSPHTNPNADPRLCNLGEGFDPATQGWKYGEYTVKELKKKHEEDVPSFPITDYKVHYHPDTQVLTKVDDLLDTDSDVMTASDATSAADRYSPDKEARERGIMLHEILSRIETLADSDKAIASVRLSMRLTTDQIAEVSASVKEMLNPADARIRRWFEDNAGVLTEQSIYLPEGLAERETGDDGNKRPDRIVFNTDGTIDIVDYKFTSETRSSHRRQIEKYMALLRSMGYERVRGFLWYPFLQKIISTDE